MQMRNPAVSQVIGIRWSSIPFRSLQSDIQGTTFFIESASREEDSRSQPAEHCLQNLPKWIAAEKLHQVITKNLTGSIAAVTLRQSRGTRRDNRLASLPSDVLCVVLHPGSKAIEID